MTGRTPTRSGPRTRAAALLISLCTTLATPLVASAAIAVDQVPLTVQQPLAPNIVLMLDDSGSMAWNFMPDLIFLNGVSQGSGRYSGPSVNNNALIDAANNDVYYNPVVTYTPPPKADSTAASPDIYPNSPGFTQAWANGFTDTTDTVDLGTYANSNNPAGTDCSGYPTYAAAYETNYGCVSLGSSNIATSTVTSQTYTYTVPATVSSASQCSTLYSNDPVSVGGGGGYYGGGYCLGGNSSCSYNSSTGACSWPRYYHYFQYSTGPAAGPYTVYYVASANQGCGTMPKGVTCVTETDTSGTAAPAGITAGQNIANWYTYYRTHLLTAQSGLMTAFSTLSPTTRFGFGSIDGNNVGALGSNYHAFQTQVPNGGGTITYNTGIAIVEPFGDGTAGTQKANFWNWITGETAGGGTPLRQALSYVGQYYQTAQPWQNSGSDTTELACRQSYTILTTDGFWNGSSPGLSPPNSDNIAGPTVVGANDQKYTYSPASPYSENTDDTLADVAMYYWEHDLQPGIPNEVPPSTEDPAFWQHMTTFTIGLGFSPVNIAGTAADGSQDNTYSNNAYGSTPLSTVLQFVSDIFAWANGGAAISNFGWPQPTSNSINNIADLAHAAVNGHGGFYSATSPQAFAGGLESALDRVAERVGTGASLAANSTKLQTGTTTYQALYYTGKWKGDLKAYAVDPNTGAISTTPTWAASAQLPAWGSRNIYTYNPAGGSGKQFVAFNSPSALSTAEQSALGATATIQQNIINYLRGNSSLETSNSNGIYRQRDTPLGDIVDSQPVYEGAPDANIFYNQTFTGSDTYSAFAGTENTREQTIWVAANDGMLHEFDATSGAEVFAYLPGAVITSNVVGATETGVANLADPNYGGSNPHEYFNDGELTIADVDLNGAWTTVLVGTTGRGPAKAVYALNVTNPASPQLLWERSAGDGQSGSDDIGQMIGKPVIAQTGNGTWSVLIGNGYNSAAGTADLLQFDLGSGALTVYPTTTATSNGLAAPSVWIGTITNDLSTTAYAGDLLGDVWSFDLTQPGSTGTLLFTAKDSSGTAQPITDGLLAGKDPATGNVWLFFGTGQYLSQSDLGNINVQTWYGLIVQSGPGQPATLVSNLANGRTALVQRSILDEVEPDPNANPPTLGGRVISTPSPGDMSGKSGWYIDLESPTGSGGSEVQQGERMVTPNQFQGALLIGTTRIPIASDPCNPSGRGWIMAINPFTGTNPTAPFFDLNADGKFTDADKLSYNGQLYASAAVGFNSVPNNPIFVGNTMLTSFDNATTSSIDTAGSVGPVGRVSWRELVNP